MRVFTSAPIVKRYDVFTLETADGIYVVIKGFINKSRTMENGFPSEVCFSFCFLLYVTHYLYLSKYTIKMILYIRALIYSLWINDVILVYGAIKEVLVSGCNLVLFSSDLSTRSPIVTW